jgi:large subunit ribosomal protein L25
VPVVLKGEPKGVKVQGGIMDFVTREIELECLPGDIPEHITVEVGELLLNQGIRVRDLVPEDGKWTAISEGEMMIVHVVPLRAEEPTAAAEPAAAGTEPEVIKKGKPEKDEQ